MAFSARGLPLLAAMALALAGCKGAYKAVDETVSLPVQAATEGVKAVGEGVGRLGKAAEKGLVGQLVTDRNRFSLLHERRDLVEHMGKLEKFLRQRQITLPPNEKRILRSARDRLAAAGRLLEAERIPARTGADIHRQFKSIRGTFDLFHESHNAPPYTGFVALR